MKLTKTKIKRAKEWIDCQSGYDEIDETLHALADVYGRVMALLKSWEADPDAAEKPRRYERELRRALEG
jgi:hypothetical protein